MAKPAEFVKLLNSLKISPLIMVPCSIFKPLTNWALSNKISLIIPPNEAHAMGFAAGSYSASDKPAGIFIQNSGLNNIANAQTSLNLLYKIPTLLIVSWRGEKPEAPEHNVMGKSLKDFFKVLQIRFAVLGEKNWRQQVKKMVSFAKSTKTPAAVVLRKGFFQDDEVLAKQGLDKYPLSRFEAVKIIKQSLAKKAVFVSATGHPSRDSFAVSPTPDFYTMGSMGHVFSIGAGTSWQLKQNNLNLRVVVLDGDGGCLMHLGSLAMVGLDKIKKSSFVYVVLDNEAYESTGNQPSLSPNVDFVKVAEGLGFPQAFRAESKKELKKALNKIKPNRAAFIHVKVNQKKEKTPRVSDHYSCEQVAKRFRLKIKKLTTQEDESV